MGVPAVMRGSSDRRHGVVLWAVKNGIYLVVVGAVLLGGSGHVRWAAAWVYLVFLAAFLLLLGVLTGRLHPDLLVERSGVQEGVEAWDVPLASLMAVWLPLAVYAVAALDERFGWPPALSLAVRVAAGLLVLAGSALSLWAMTANAWFSAVVRIQADRGQRVVTTGPYRLVRHPGYLGTLLLYPGVALWLGSAWALAPVAALAAVVVIRTAREDQLLLARLSGYPGYAMRVRRRLVPMVW